jgi:hypothetical protein
MLLQVWCARQLARVPGVLQVTDVMGAWYVKLVSAGGVSATGSVDSLPVTTAC